MRRKERVWHVIRTPNGFMCGFDHDKPVFSSDKSKALRYGKETAEMQAVIFDEFEIMKSD